MRDSGRVRTRGSEVFRKASVRGSMTVSEEVLQGASYVIRGHGTCYTPA